MKPNLRLLGNLLLVVATALGLARPAGAVQLGSVPSGGRISLNGMWNFSIHGHGQRLVRVPSTYLPVGGATLERYFDLPVEPTDRRILLKFDGIIMTDVISLNGQRLGEFGPYTPFTIDVTTHVKPGRNHLRVELSDLDGFAPLGRSWVTAFPRFGGIMRRSATAMPPTCWKPAPTCARSRCCWVIANWNTRPSICIFRANI